VSNVLSISSRTLALSLVAVLLALLGVAGCGYSSKSLYPTSVQTISVPIFENKTFRRDTEMRLTEAVCKAIESRTPYRLAARESADTILIGEIDSIEEEVLIRTSGINIPEETKITFKVNFVWKDLRSGKILARKKGLTASATHIPAIGERTADASQATVERMAWAVVDEMAVDW